VILASDILRWLIPKVGKFPKNVRFGLGARLEAAHFDVLEELIRAQYARGGGARTQSPFRGLRTAPGAHAGGPRQPGGRMAKGIGRNGELFRTLCDRDKWLNAQEMLEYGLIDGILERLPGK
jgi:hypothetical protein